MLSIGNIESLVISSIIESKTSIFTKKIPNDNTLKKNFKSILNTTEQTVNFPFDLPNGENVILFGIRGVILQGSSISLDLSLINVITVNNGKPLDVLGESEDSDSGCSDESEILSPSFVFN